jgi:hypothetical protein
MNAPVSRLPEDPRRRPSADDAAAELHAAGEALCRAARVLALMTRSLPRAEQARRPSASSSQEPAERLSGKQLGAIRAASRRAGLSRDRLASLLEELTGKQEPSSLSRSDASLVLDKLSAMTGFTR